MRIARASRQAKVVTISAAAVQPRRSSCMVSVSGVAWSGAPRSRGISSWF
jgi:hypothetical protein